MSKWQAFSVNGVGRKIGKISEKIGMMCEQWKDSDTHIKWKKMRKYIWIDLVHICICLNSHFMSLWWQVSWDLFLCTQWNFFHCSLFHYSFCNVPDILCVRGFSSRFPYHCPFTFWCRGLLFCILLTISSCVFAYWYMLCYTVRMIPLAHSSSLLQCLPRLSIGI